MGDAGDFLGAPLEGEMEGVDRRPHDRARKRGARAGDRLRRGTIVIEGSAGDFPGSRMIAGTLIVLKDCGALPGYLMRRGTIVLANPPELAPTFVDCGIHELAFAEPVRELAAPRKPRRRAASRPPARALRRRHGGSRKGRNFLPRVMLDQDRNRHG